MPPYDPHLHGPVRAVGPGFHARVHALVRGIPRGRVATYGDLARALGHARAARQVGYALRACPPDVPWHRVVNTRGEVSPRADGSPSAEQIRALRGEGIRVGGSGRVHDFARLRFEP